MRERSGVGESELRHAAAERHRFRARFRRTAVVACVVRYYPSPERALGREHRRLLRARNESLQRARSEPQHDAPLLTRRRGQPPRIRRSERDRVDDGRDQPSLVAALPAVRASTGCHVGLETPPSKATLSLNGATPSVIIWNL